MLPHCAVYPARKTYTSTAEYDAMFLYHRATCGASAASGARGMDFIRATSALVGRALQNVPHHRVTAKAEYCTAHTGRELENGSTRARHHAARNERGARPTETNRFRPKKKIATKRLKPPARAHASTAGQGTAAGKSDAPIDKAGRRQEVVELGNTRRRVQVRKGRHFLDRREREQNKQPQPQLSMGWGAGRAAAAGRWGA